MGRRRFQPAMAAVVYLSHGSRRPTDRRRRATIPGLTVRYDFDGLRRLPGIYRRRTGYGRIRGRDRPARRPSRSHLVGPRLFAAAELHQSTPHLHATVATLALSVRRARIGAWNMHRPGP